MSASPSAEIRVLVVDDDPGARRLHGLYVSRAPGFTVTATVPGACGGVSASNVVVEMNVVEAAGVIPNTT